MRITPSHDRWLNLNNLLSALLAQNRIQQSCATQAMVRSREASSATLHPWYFLRSNNSAIPIGEAGFSILKPSLPGSPTMQGNPTCALIRSRSMSPP